MGRKTKTREDLRSIHIKKEKTNYHSLHKHDFYPLENPKQ